MPNLRYAPEFQLTISGRPAPRELRASVTAVRLTNGFEGADRLEVSLVNENLRWLDSPLLALDNNVAVEMGYAPDPLSQLFVGEIVTKSATFPSSGPPMLEVAAQDRRRKLQEGKLARWFAIPIPNFGNLPLP